MESNIIKDIIESTLTDSQVQIDGDGQHFNAQIISTAFESLSSLARQRLVYDALNTYIESGELHAISMKTYTPAEWEQQNG